MRRNLAAGGGLVMAERVAFLLAPRLGVGEAHEVLAGAARRAAAAGRRLRDELLADERVELAPEELEAALEPATYLGSAERFVARALERYAAERGAE
jgi:3-carboxy-cis,cis-muconate cycloisomerase